jgi:hypothetical protein
VASASRSSVSAASRVCPVLLAASISSGRAKRGDKQLRRLLGGLLRVGKGRLIAAETVVQDGRYPLRPLDAYALSSSSGALDDGLDQLGRLGFRPRNPASHTAANGAKRVPVAAAIASASAISEAAAAKSPRQTVMMAIAFTEIGRRQRRYGTLPVGECHLDRCPAEWGHADKALVGDDAKRALVVADDHPFYRAGCAPCSLTGPTSTWPVRPPLPSRPSRWPLRPRPTSS